VNNGTWTSLVGEYVSDLAEGAIQEDASDAFLGPAAADPLTEVR